MTFIIMAVPCLDPVGNNVVVTLDPSEVAGTSLFREQNLCSGVGLGFQAHSLCCFFICL